VAGGASGAVVRGAAAGRLSFDARTTRQNDRVVFAVSTVAIVAIAAVIIVALIAAIYLLPRGGRRRP
jgi:Na+/melibiose symporter-like transporter